MQRAGKHGYCSYAELQKIRIKNALSGSADDPEHYSRGILPLLYLYSLFL